MPGSAAAPGAVELLWVTRAGRRQPGRLTALRTNTLFLNCSTCIYPSIFSVSSRLI